MGASVGEEVGISVGAVGLELTSTGDKGTAVGSLVGDGVGRLGPEVGALEGT